MIIYVIVHIKALERIKCGCVIQRSGERTWIEDGEEMGSTKNAVDVNHGHVGCTMKIVGRYDPHSIVGVWLMTKYGIPVNEGTLVAHSIERE